MRIFGHNSGVDSESRLSLIHIFTRVSRQGQGVLLVAVDGVGDHIVLVQIGVGRGM